VHSSSRPRLGEPQLFTHRRKTKGASSYLNLGSRAISTRAVAHPAWRTRWEKRPHVRTNRVSCDSSARLILVREGWACGREKNEPAGNSERDPVVSSHESLPGSDKDHVFFPNNHTFPNPSSYPSRNAGETCKNRSRRNVNIVGTEISIRSTPSQHSGNTGGKEPLALDWQSLFACA
jgi:hypothetical protein